MNIFILYLLLLKATMTSFSGLASLPMIRDDLVVSRGVLTDHQLSAAVAAGRLGPGPIGLYVVSVGYFVAGVPGAIAGWAAMITPAFLIIPILRYLGSRAEHPRVKGAIRAVTNAAAGLIVAAAAPLAAQVIIGPVQIAVAIAAFLALALTRLDTLWVIAGSAVIGLSAALLH